MLYSASRARIASISVRYSRKETGTRASRSSRKKPVNISRRPSPVLPLLAGYGARTSPEESAAGDSPPACGGRQEGGSQPRTAALRLVAGFPLPALPRKRGRNHQEPRWVNPGAASGGETARASRMPLAAVQEGEALEEVDVLLA